MARGFESKSVADQQAAQETFAVRDEAGDASVLLKRRKLELARTDVVRKMKTAKAEAHREILRRALEALDTELSALH
jgi:hypothetical protein